MNIIKHTLYTVDVCYFILPLLFKHHCNAWPFKTSCFILSLFQVQAFL